MFTKNMDVLYFLLPLSAFGGVLFDIEIGIMKVIMEILKVWIGPFLINSSKSMNPGRISTSNQLYFYYYYPSYNETNLALSNLCYIRSCCILGAFCGAILASFFGKKFERHRKKKNLLFFLSII